jgi:DNA end-binding protein Ku
LVPVVTTIVRNFETTSAAARLLVYRLELAQSRLLRGPTSTGVPCGLFATFLKLGKCFADLPSEQLSHREKSSGHARRPEEGLPEMPATVWKGYLSFGLVSFPVRLFSAARAEAVHFHWLHRQDLSRVKEVWYCVEEDQLIERSQIVKGYEVEKGRYVTVEDEELKKVAPATATTMEVQQFVANGEVDPLLFEDSYYVAPDEKVSKPYALFAAALNETKCDAIAKVAMHNREHVVLIRPSEGGLVLHTLYYADELHAANKTEAPKASYSTKELALAKSLIQNLTAKFKFEEFHDTYRENVERLIEEKNKGKKVTLVKQSRKAPVIDLMDALKKSLQATSSPANAEQRARSRAATKKPARKRKAA